MIHFATGKMAPHPDLSPDASGAAQDTIRRLRLDSPENNEMRANHFEEYLRGACSLAFLSRKSPFVYAEIVRQGLL